MNKQRIFGILMAGVIIAMTCKTGNAEQAPSLPHTLDEMAAALVIEKPQAHKELTIYPLSLVDIKNPAAFLTLDDAMKRNKLRISEWGAGQVPKLKVENKAKEKVFIMAGEIVTGAKQDRMSAHDVLLEPSRDPVSLPVYCVEQGRWVMNSREFASGETAGTKKLRRSAVNKYNQGKIWEDVAEKSSQSGVRTSTGTMQAVYNDPRIKNQIAEYVTVFQELPKKIKNMVGFVIVINSKIESADIFDNPRLVEKLWLKLLRAAAVDAATQKQEKRESPSLKQIQQFLSDGLSGQFRRIDNPGLGHEFMIDGTSGISGSTLIHNNAMIHLALFSAEKGERPRELRPDVTQPKKRYEREVGKEKETAVPSQRNYKSKEIHIRTYKDKQRDLVK